MKELAIVEPVVNKKGVEYHVLHVIERPIPHGTRLTVIKTVDVFDSKQVAESVRDAWRPPH